MAVLLLMVFVPFTVIIFSLLVTARKSSRMLDDYLVADESKSINA